MLYFGASTKVMPLPLIYRLGLQISRPYRNICALGSREVKVCGFINCVVVSLTTHPYIILRMDIVMVDVLEAWGML